MKDIPRCDPKWDHKPISGKEYIEYLKTNMSTSFHNAKELTIARYKDVRQNWKCLKEPKHDWYSVCPRCKESDFLERIIAIMEVLEENR